MIESLPDPDITLALTLLRRWLSATAPAGTVIMQAYQNNVPAPSCPYMLMRPIETTWLSRPWRSFSEGEVTTYMILRLDIEVTAFGDHADSVSHTLALQFCDPSVTDWFHAQDRQVTPLEASQPVSEVGQDDGRGYVKGWTWQLALQLNQTVTTEIETAKSASIQVAPTYQAE